MAGLVKAKKYDWKDSNLALFGSDLERKVNRIYFLYNIVLSTINANFSSKLYRYIHIYIIIYIIQVKEAAAKTEQAWKEAGKVEGVQIWRIVDFNVSFLQFILSFYNQYSI